MSEIKREKQLAGSTTTAQDLKPSLQNLKDGSEPDAMLLALLWSPTVTLMNRKRAVLANANYQGQPATVIILVGTEYANNGIHVVGNAIGKSDE